MIPLSNLPAREFPIPCQMLRPDPLRRSLLGEDVGAEIEKSPADLRVPGSGHRRRHEAAVPAPHVGIGVPAEMDDIRIVGRDDRPAGVDLRAQDEEARLKMSATASGRSAKSRGSFLAQASQ